MKSKVENHKKDLTVVQQLRQVRDKINHEIKEFATKRIDGILEESKNTSCGGCMAS